MSQLTHWPAFREPVHPLGDSLTRWVPVPMASDPVHPLGFVATDPPTGCTWPHRFPGGGLRPGITAASDTMAGDGQRLRSRGGAKQDPCQLRDGAG
jgi:hypothetical protein